jgi:hypothetical protein
MLTRTDTALDRPMILFQDVVEILHRSMSTVLPQNTGGFELNDGWRISSVLVGIDYPRRGMVLPAQGFGQKALSRCCVAFSRQTGLRMNLERKNYERLLRYSHRYFRPAYFHGISPLAIEACPTSCSQGRTFVV